MQERNALISTILEQLSALLEREDMTEDKKLEIVRKLQSMIEIVGE